MEHAAARWDLLYRNALMMDGSGNRPSLGDVAIAKGRIAQIGTGLPAAQAAEVRDLDGQWLMPGLLDIHTHFDLEVEIEPGLPEAVRHGTTTVVVANCSLGLAFGAQRRDGADPIVDCFARVENVPKHVLKKVGDKVLWNDSQAYLDHFDTLPLGANIVPMIPHSMLRIEVMGLQASVSRDPTPAELQRMGELLEKGMREGYVGFSTDALPFHFLANQPNVSKQIPTQFAKYGELKFLTHVVRGWDRVWQATPPKDNKLAVFRNFLLTSGRLFGRTLKVTAVAALDLHTNRPLAKMARLLSRILNSDFLRGRFRFQALSAPFKVWSDGPFTPFSEEIPELRRLVETDLGDVGARRAILDDADYIRAFRTMWFHGRRGFGLARLKHWLKADDNVLTRELADMTIETCPVADWNGGSLQAIYARLLRWQQDGSGARSRDETAAFSKFPRPAGDEADFFLHLLREYDTALRWWCTPANGNPEVVKDLLFNPLMLPGFNDSGAHLTNMAFYDGNLRMLKIAQADGVDKVAQAVRRLSAEPAEFFGLDVGTIKVGATADLLVVDPAALQRYEPEACVRYIYRDAFEHHQLVNRPDGVVREVLIAGKLAWKDGSYTAAFGKQRMGSVLKHRDHGAAPSPELRAAA